MLRDFVILLSLVNVAYLRVWTEVLTGSQKDLFWTARPIDVTTYITPVVGALLLTIILWLLTICARLKFVGWPERLSFALFVAAAATPVVVIREVLVTYYPETFATLREPLMRAAGLPLARGAGLLLAGVAVAATVRWFRSVTRFLAKVFIVVSPFVIVTFGTALTKAVQFRSTPPPAVTTAPMLNSAASGHRVVWVIFDEWDYRLTFPDRAPGLGLPNLDRLRKETFFAKAVLPPNIYRTQRSIPSLLESRIIDDLQPISETQAIVHYPKTQERAQWGSSPNVFASVRAAGRNVGVVGWYLPYCRVFGPILSDCTWAQMATQANTTGGTFWQQLRNQARSIFESRTLSPFGQSLVTKEKAHNTQLLIDAARRAVVDPRLGFAFIHLPFPHNPHAYSRETGDFSLANKTVTGYIDSLALVDRTVGELRARMENAGMWDDATILLTSDHSFRSSSALDGKWSWRVPFMLKLPGQHQALEYSRCFNSVVTAKLLLTAMSGGIRDAAGVAAWLNSQHSACDEATATMPNDPE